MTISTRHSCLGMARLMCWEVKTFSHDIGLPHRSSQLEGSRMGSSRAGLSR